MAYHFKVTNHPTACSAGIMSTAPNPMPIVVAALYHFSALDNVVELRAQLLEFCRAREVKGTLLLASEGINGTVAGNRLSIDQLIDFLQADVRLAGLRHKESYCESPPFARMKVKLKNEIVTMGVPDTDPNVQCGVRVDAREWNALIADPDVLVIDTRNTYEHQIGTFDRAVSPDTETFREFPDFVGRHLDSTRDKKIAMFCTGGIRCEKATNFLLREGFDEVYHLDGGILKYLETVPAEQTMWRGECFVFDDRVAVDAELNPGSYVQCSACRRPISHEERHSADYVEGISCPHCINSVSEDKRRGLAEHKRQQQLAAARTRGESK